MPLAKGQESVLERLVDEAERIETAARGLGMMFRTRGRVMPVSMHLGAHQELEQERNEGKRKHQARDEGEDDRQRERREEILGRSG